MKIPDWFCVNSVWSPSGVITSLSFDNQFVFAATGHDDGTVKLWNLLSTNPYQEFVSSCKEPVHSIAFTESTIVAMHQTTQRQLVLWNRLNGLVLHVVILVSAEK